MKTIPLYTVHNHSIVFNRAGLRLLRAYIYTFLRTLQEQVSEYHKAQALVVSAPAMHKPIQVDTQLVTDVADMIAQAEQMVSDLDFLTDHLEALYTMHYEALALMMRKTRQELALSQIEQDSALQIVLHHMMDMLHTENTRFNMSLFVTYINADEEVLDAATA